jgi:hypothetical protein
LSNTAYKTENKPVHSYIKIQPTNQDDAQLLEAIRSHVSGDGVCAALELAQQYNLTKMIHNVIYMTRLTFHPSAKPLLESEDGPVFIITLNSKCSAKETARLKRELLTKLHKEPSTHDHIDKLIFYISAC